jgi:hypothetical protein
LLRRINFHAVRLPANHPQRVGYVLFSVPILESTKEPTGQQNQETSMTQHFARPSCAFPLSFDDSLWHLLWKESIFRAIAGLSGTAFTRFF